MTPAALQWRLFRATLDPVLGSEQVGTRPVLVVSREVINQALPVVAVVPLTSLKPGRRVYSTEVLLPAGAAGQPEASLALAHQVRTISVRRLGSPFGELADPQLRSRAREALKVFLDFE
ncbi:MAG: type II toxin-antitoxin system PemK/MazF family toxin [Holophagales bacterium]|nr:type II toxin-antitoxin system PemK/MazF family toxin [Holophagales bacterium]